MEIILNKLRDDGQRVSKLEVKSVMDFVDANGDRLVGFDEFIRVRMACRMCRTSAHYEILKF